VRRPALLRHVWVELERCDWNGNECIERLWRHGRFRAIELFVDVVGRIELDEFEWDRFGDVVRFNWRGRLSTLEGFVLAVLAVLGERAASFGISRRLSAAPGGSVRTLDGRSAHRPAIRAGDGRGAPPAGFHGGRRAQSAATHAWHRKSFGGLKLANSAVSHHR